jgi:hypothetical protein
MVKRTDIDVNKIKELYLSGLSVKSISDKMGINNGVIERRLKKLNIVKRRGAEALTDIGRKIKSNLLKGKKGLNWKGGRIINENGYIEIYCPTHPYARKSGYVLEHRLVMEAHIGRVLLPTEVCHHINGRHDDNHIENLSLFSTNGEHTRNHFKGRVFSDEWKKKISESRKKRLRGRGLPSTT